jgi:hypothetical protein
VPLGVHTKIIFMIAKVDEIFPIFILCGSTIKKISQLNLSVFQKESCIVGFETNAQL